MLSKILEGIFIVVSVAILFVVNFAAWIFTGGDTFGHKEGDQCSEQLFTGYLDIDKPEAISDLECEIRDFFPVFLTDSEFSFNSEEDYIEFLGDAGAEDIEVVDCNCLELI